MSTAAASDRLPLSRLGLLFALYFAQGLPFGFQLYGLPVFMRRAGASLTVISLASAVSLPWLLKPLWAPLVDAHGSRRLGRRRSWILPMQLGIAAACAVAAFTEPDQALLPLLATLLMMNLFAATLDIAVDGLAIDSLRREHLGYGNIAQVVGYKLGMLTAGGVLLSIKDDITWAGMFAVMAALVCAVTVLVLFFREPSPNDDAPGDPAVTVRHVVRLLWDALKVSRARWILLFIATYKMGETIADGLFKPFLVDSGYSDQQIALWISTYGLLASIAGSAAGGVLAARIDLVRAVGLTAALRVVPVIGELWLVVAGPSASGVIGVTVAEHFFGGALTTCMFAFMMSQVDRRIGATHFTLFAAIEVLGKSASGILAGAIADATSYAFAFSAAVVLSIAFLALLVPVGRASTAPASPPSPPT